MTGSYPEPQGRTPEVGDGGEISESAADRPAARAQDWTAAHPVTPRSFFTIDAGTATIAAALVGRVSRRWRLLGATAGPAGFASPVDGAGDTRRASAQAVAGDAEEAALAALVDRVRRADPDLARSVGMGPGTDPLAILPRVVARSAVPRTLVVVAATEASLARLAASASGAGWCVVGSSAERADPLEILTLATRPSTDAVLIGIIDPPGPEERDLRAELASVAASIGIRRPGLRVYLAGPIPDPPPGTAAGQDTLERVPAPGPVAGAPDDPLLGALSDRVAPDDTRAGLARAAGSLARVLGLRVELVEIGVGGATRVRAEVDPASGESRVASLQAPEASLFALGDPSAPDRVEAWLTLAIDRSRLRDRLGELTLAPWSDLDGEGAILRAAALRAALERLDAATAGALGGDVPDLLVLTGGAFSAVPPSAAALLVSDVLRRPGAVTIALDQARLLGPIGTILDDGERDNVTRDLAGDLLVPLGTLVMARGLRGGRHGGTMTVEAAGASSRTELFGGHLALVELPPGARGVADLAFRGQLDVGPRARRVALPVTGGLGGLLVDLRDIPLRLPDRPDRRRDVLGEWERAAWPEHDQ